MGIYIKKKFFKKTPLENVTYKQRRFLKEYIRTGNATEAAYLAYNCSRTSAASIGHDLLRMIDMDVLMEEMGLTKAKLLQKHAEGLDATRKRAEITDRDDKGRPVYEYYDEPDMPTRHKYLETAYKLRRMLIDRQEVTGENGQPISIIIGNGFVPAGVVIDATPEDSTSGGQPSVQSPRLAQESQKNYDGNI